MACHLRLRPALPRHARRNPATRLPAMPTQTMNPALTYGYLIAFFAAMTSLPSPSSRTAPCSPIKANAQPAPWHSTASPAASRQRNPQSHAQSPNSTTSQPSGQPPATRHSTTATIKRHELPTAQRADGPKVGSAFSWSHVLKIGTWPRTQKRNVEVVKIGTCLIIIDKYIAQPSCSQWQNAALSPTLPAAGVWISNPRQTAKTASFRLTFAKIASLRSPTTNRRTSVDTSISPFSSWNHQLRSI